MDKNEDIIAEIGRLEDMRYAAMLGKDADALQRLLHEKLVYMHSSGISDSKDSYITGLREGVWDYRRVERSEQTVLTEGSLALVFNRLSINIIVRGVAKELDNRALAVWVANEGAWKLIAVQSGAIPSTGK
jgi:ketosteroid isomerase-like protein